MSTQKPRIRGPITLALGGGALATAFVAGVAAAGGLGGATPGPDPAPPMTPAAGKGALVTFDGCDDLLRSLVRENIGQVGPYGFETPVLTNMEGRVAAGAGAAEAGEDAAAPTQGSPDEAVTSSRTGTNVQEAGVDEADVAKTDGDVVVHLSAGGTRVLVTDVSGDDPEELAAVSLPRNLQGRELLLVDDHVLVTTSSFGPWNDTPSPEGGSAWPEWPDSSPESWPGPSEEWPQEWPDEGPDDSRFDGRLLPTTPTGVLVDVDISDPADARVVRVEEYSGEITAVRQYGDVVRVVTRTERPRLDWVRPRGYDGAEKATERNREILRQSTIEDWLPWVEVDGKRSRVDCADVHLPDRWSGPGMVTVFGYDVDEPAQRDSVAVATGSDVVYSSTDRLYVATQPWSREFWHRGRGWSDRELAPRGTVTQLHAFALSGTEARHHASGEVAGTVKDRWSLDAHDGRLRVAVTSSGRGDVGPARDRSATSSSVVVLAERGGRLVETGRADDLGIDEEIKAVRWFDDLAVVVTFRQVDPLYTIDLSDPDRPRARGELKIPGFSQYLHPVGEDLLLGLGVDADTDGRVRGAQAAVFDIGDLEDPQRLDTVAFGPDTHLTATEDPRAFTWLPGGTPGSGRALTLLDDWSGQGGTRPIVLEVDDQRLAGEPLAGTRYDHPVDVRRVLPLGDDRVAIVGEQVQVLDVG